MAKMASIHAEQFEIPQMQVGETISWGRVGRSYTIVGITDLHNGKMSLTVKDIKGKVSSEVIDLRAFVRRR